jgi:hypothetical protein
MEKWQVQGNSSTVESMLASSLNSVFLFRRLELYPPETNTFHLIGPASQINSLRCAAYVCVCYGKYSV